MLLRAAEFAPQFIFPNTPWIWTDWPCQVQIIRHQIEMSNSVQQKEYKPMQWNWYAISVCVWDAVCHCSPLYTIIINRLAHSVDSRAVVGEPSQCLQTIKSYRLVHGCVYHVSIEVAVLYESESTLVSTNVAVRAHSILLTTYYTIIWKKYFFFYFSCSLLLLFLLNKPANLYRYGACLSLSDLETMHLIVFRCICGASDDGGRADVLSSVTAVAGGGWRWPSTIMYQYMFYCSSNTWIVLMCDSMCVCVYVSGTHIAPGVKATRQ